MFSWITDPKIRAAMPWGEIFSTIGMAIGLILVCKYAVPWAWKQLRG